MGSREAQAQASHLGESGGEGSSSLLAPKGSHKAGREPAESLVWGWGGWGKGVPSLQCLSPGRGAEPSCCSLLPEVMK